MKKARDHRSKAPSDLVDVADDGIRGMLRNNEIVPGRIIAGEMG